MYRVGRRSLSVLLVIAVITAGMCYYLYRYVKYGSTWAGAPFNQAVYDGGILSTGTVTDRNGIILADITEDGKRTFAGSEDLRIATLHAVGDKDGNIGTGALRAFSSELTGYNLITGSYTLKNDNSNKIALTIDAKYNIEAYKALDGRAGTVIVSNYQTGEILCMVSNPGFDPAFPPDVGQIDEESGIYLNRAIQSAYTPGSTFKLLTAAAAIEQIKDIDERIFICTGELKTEDGTITCNDVHGSINFTQALRRSCNIAFGEIALELGADTLAKYAEKYNLSGSISINGISTIKGNYEKAAPDSADLAWSGVGQYTDTVCPAVMLQFTSAVANNGKAAPLHLIQKSGLSGLIPQPSTGLMSRSTAAKLSEMMEIQNDDGFPGLMIHAKSGTAQVGSDRLPHAWYVGYISNPHSPYAFVVVIENGGGGRAAAGPVANKVLQAMIK